VIIQLVFGISTGLSALLFGFLGDFTVRAFFFISKGFLFFITLLLKKQFNRVHYHTLVFFVYGIVQIMIPFAPNFIVFLFQMTILGIMDGVLLCFIVPISYDLTKSSKLANHASGFHFSQIKKKKTNGISFFSSRLLSCHNESNSSGRRSSGRSHLRNMAQL